MLTKFVSQLSFGRRRWVHALAGSVSCFAVACGAAFVALTEVSAHAATLDDTNKKQANDEGLDMLIFRDGTVRKGTVISQTATTVKFKGLVAGIPFETEYSVSDILKVVRGTPNAADAAKPAEGTKADNPAASPAGTKTDKPVDSASLGGKTTYYWITLEGEFGEQISETPLREAIRDARRSGVQTIIIEFHPDWSIAERSQLPEMMARFDEIFRAERLAEIFTNDIRKNWDTQPRIAFWVRNAMGGAALLPLICNELYFSSEARMGGLGNLSQTFKGVGDDVVGAKQRSLRLGHAEGWAIAGGHDPRLIRAMARIEYVLSYRMKDGKPEFFEGYPTNPGEELLTDDGLESNADTLAGVIRGEGNDVLTINARTAEILGISRATVDSKDDLLGAMDLGLNGVLVPGRAKNIQRDWVNGLENAKRQIRKLIQDYRDVRVTGDDRAARSRARGRTLSILESMKSIIKGKFGEGISPRWLAENDVPSETEINVLIEQIKIEQLKDK